MVQNTTMTTLCTQEFNDITVSFYPFIISVSVLGNMNESTHLEINVLILLSYWHNISEILSQFTSHQGLCHSFMALGRASSRN